eukprot:Anaeramoba_flamelloidesc39049_g1_i1.p2 GENE.c39049_g1_i1~~c39049_g1_i1.p2  ORF type:complete len:133 (+),score=21.50 c39049_g1_i1:920-1318(+)
MFECVSECNGYVRDYSRKSFQAVQSLITFIYTGKTDHITPHLALELLDAVGYYGINENSVLKKFTEVSSHKLSKWKIRKFYKNQKKLELKKQKSNKKQSNANDFKIIFYDFQIDNFVKYRNQQNYQSENHRK